MTPAIPPQTTQDTIQFRFHCKQLDEAQTRLLAEQLIDQAQAAGTHEVHLDFSEVESLSPCCLMQLMVLSRRLQADGKTLCLRNVQPDVYATLLANKVTNLFHLTFAA